MIDYKKLGKSYALSIAALTVIVALIFEVFRWLLGIQPPSSAGFAAIVVATLFPARWFAATYQRRPTGKEGWMIAVIFTLIAAVVNALVLLVFWIAMPGLGPVADMLLSAAGLLVVAFFMGLIVLMLRFVFPYFVRLSLRAAELPE